MKTWWLETLQHFLQSMLEWVSALQGKSPRKEGQALWSKDVHVPTPLVALGAVVALFVVLAPKAGLSLPHLVALAGLLILLLTFFVIYARLDLPPFLNDDEAVFLTGLLVVLGALIIEAGTSLPQVSFVALPLSAITMLASLLLHVRLALLISVILSFLAGALFDFKLEVAMTAFFSTMAALAACRNVRTRGDLIRAGLHVAWVTFALSAGLELLRAKGSAANLFPWAVWSFVNGVLSAGLTLALLPFLESFFSRITNITLLELGDFNRPLLRRLMLEAPGTYHHTLLVAALAEQAAQAIGANALLARVGMYYHDIGKMLHPDYFIENQITRRSAKERPEHHDKLNPSISSLVILSHVKDGAALARAYKLPQEIARFIPEHHGTSLIKYFYVQALEKSDEDNAASEESYRYPGPRPHSKETAIGMMADSVEAASRTVEEPTYERLHDLVEKIVFTKLEDGQFDECPLTLNDLRHIVESFTQSLSAIYHVRIEYPELPKNPKTAE